MDILVIDDSTTTQSFLSDILKRAGHGVHEAHNGLSGLIKIMDVKPDLIILDLLMPDMNGIEVLEKLKIANSRIPLIVLTANIQEAVRNECLELGARQLINKPFLPADILSAINHSK